MNAFGKAFVGTVAGLTLLLGVTSAHAGIWIESGDAGNISNPQPTIGVGGLSDIFGSIGGGDVVDVFAFQHTAPSGFFFVGSTLSSGEHPTITLYDSAKAVVTSDADNIDLSPIPVGVYFIEIAINGTPTTYHLFFDGEAQFFAESVPEPSTFALLGLGLVALGWSRRRK
jgi:hypothetical protein